MFVIKNSKCQFSHLTFYCIVMQKSVKRQLSSQIKYYENLKKYFEKRLKELTPDINNAKYIKILAKLSEIDIKILTLKAALKKLKRANTFSKRFIVALNSRVKLISLDFQVVLWVDAQNLNTLIGRSVGDVVNLYNSNFKIAGVY